MTGEWAKIFLVLGLLFLGIGCLLLLAPKIPWLGRLPGDILWKNDKFVLYAPLMTSVILSLLVSLILWLVRRP